jgi:hypothetical protein
MSELKEVNELGIRDALDLEREFEAYAGEAGVFDAPGPLFDGDTGTLALEIRETSVFISKKPYISAEANSDEWRILLENQELLESRFNDNFLHLVVNLEYGVAYKVQAVPDAGPPFPTLLHDTAYTLEQTILLIHLREIFRSKKAAGAEHVLIDHADLMNETANYRPTNTTNHARGATGTRNAIDSLRKSGILLKTSEVDRYRISAIIEVLLPVERLKELVTWLTTQGSEPADSADSADNDDETGMDLS